MQLEKGTNRIILRSLHWQFRQHLIRLKRCITLALTANPNYIWFLAQDGGSSKDEMDYYKQISIIKQNIVNKFTRHKGQM